MLFNKDNSSNDKLATAVKRVEELLEEGKYELCEEIICHCFAKYPHNPEPHNLMGELMEKKGNHVLAMKHFRAGYDLDPSYLPNKINLDRYSNMDGDL